MRVVNYIEKLDTKALVRFEQLVYSPYFNQHERTQSAFSYIKKCIKKGKDVDRKILHQVIYPQEKYDSQRVSNIMSNLMRLFRSFLQNEKMSPLPVSAIHELQFLFEEQLDVYFQRESKQFLSGQQHPLTRYYVHRIIGHQNKRASSQSLLEGNVSLDCFFLKEKFKMGCEMLSHKNVVSGEYDFGFFDCLESYIDKIDEDAFDYMPMRIYFLSYKMIKDDDVVLYQKLYHLLQSSGHEIDLLDQKEVFAYLQNFAVKQINQGNRGFLRELFGLYKEILDNGVLLSEGYLSEWEYKNIITAGCRLEEMEWTLVFIEEYKQWLKPLVRDNAYQYNLALYYNSTGEYSKTLDVLRGVQFSDVYYHLNTNVLLIKTYFALQEYDVLMNLLDTFRVYVLRNKQVSTYQKKLYKNLIRYTRKIVQLEESKRRMGQVSYREAKEKVIQQISSNKDVASSNWLLEVCKN